MEPERFDLIVIGGGGAAREAATRAARDRGASVAVIERGDWGGECLRVACKPTKQYVVAAELLHDLRTVADDLGVRTHGIEFDLAALRERKQWLIGTPEGWRDRYALPGVTRIDGEATISAPGTVAVGDRVLTSERVLVATGSRTAVPPIEGIDGVPWIDNVAALELNEVPGSIVVVGAGAVGLEFGQVFRRFGSEVTVVEALDRIGGRADAEAARSLRAALEDEGIEIVTGTVVAGVARQDDRIAVTLRPREGDGTVRELVVQELLLASGRRPNVEGLGLEALGVETSRAGIVVDDRLRTSVEGIWAAGDVAAGLQLTPIGAYQAQVAVADMFGGSERRAEYRAVPAAIFTDPELASVGLSEDDARAQGFAVGTSVYPGDGLLRAYYTLPRDRAAHGLVKLVYEEGSRRLLGLHAVVRGGAELVQGYALALELGVTVDDIAYGHYAFPTAAEGVHHAAEAALAGELVGT